MTDRMDLSGAFGTPVAADILPLPLPSIPPPSITCMRSSLTWDKEGGESHCAAGALGLAAPCCPFSNY